MLRPGAATDTDTPSPDELWRLTSAAIAAFGRVRVARDGRQYRRAWEQRLDPDRRPAAPAAVRTYDPSGETRAVAFDLDARKNASRAAVLRDCDRLTGWLREAGCSYFVDESVTGGRHVYVLLDHPRSHAELAPLARSLRASGVLPTLDPGPLINLTEGCIRPPGATHRAGGHQRLVTALADVRRALNRRTGSGAWAAFVAMLPAPPPSRWDLDLRSPAEDAPAGPRRPLAPRYAQIAVTGQYPRDQYPSPSEARAAVLLHALCRGWMPDDIRAEVKTGRWPGLATLFRDHYGQRYASKALDADISRAQSRQQELPLHRIHTSAARPRGDTGASARKHLRRWTAAVQLAVAGGRWETRRSYGMELVLISLGDAARRTQTIYPGFGVRHLAMGSGTALDHSTVAKLLKILATEPDPFLLLIEADRGVEPDIYELRIPDAYLQELPNDDQLPDAPIGVHPAFSLLPRPAWRVYRALEAHREPRTPAELSIAAHVPLRSVYATLTELERAGLTRRSNGGRWLLGRRSLTRFARLNGIAGRLRDLVRKWRQERNALRVMHGLEERPYGSPGAVAWPGVGREGMIAVVPSPAATRLAEVRAADPPGADWRADVEEATIELLRQMLGAERLSQDGDSDVAEA